MEIGHVGIATFAGIIFSLCASMLVPIALMIIVRKKTKAELTMVAIGAATFFLFAMVLEQICHAIVIGATGESLTGNIWLYALYGGLAAGLFEEIGRYIAMRYFIKRKLNLPNALMYGVGHGGFEAVVIIGMANISNLVAAIMINSGSMEVSLRALDQATRDQSVQQLSALWTAPAYQFFLGGVERILAITIHIALSVLVFQAVKLGRKSYWILAFAIHMAIDAVTVIIAKYLDMVLVEVLLAVMVAGLVALTVSLCRKNWSQIGFETESPMPVEPEHTEN